MKKYLILIVAIMFCSNIIAQTYEAVSNPVYLKIGKITGTPSDVDLKIPETDYVNSQVYALIVGNEDYSSYQTDLDNEVNIDFAENDARIFKEYLVKTLGVPEKNVDLRINATYGQMNQGLAKLSKIAKVQGGENVELIFYYSGHGLPDEQTKEGYLMPVDIAGTNVTSGIALNEAISKLTEFNPRKATVFLDACFSGGARNKGLVTLKGVKVKPKEESFSGNVVVFASSSGSESSAVYKDKKHGMFTYFLLKKLKESKGNVTYKELFDYLNNKVKIESVLVNDKEQTPQINGSPAVQGKWQNWKFK